MSPSHRPPGEAAPFYPAHLAALGVLRWGHRALWVGFAGSLALTAAVAWLQPGEVILLPVGVGMLAVGWWLFQRPLVNLLAVLAGYALIISPEQGIQAPEVAYGLYLLAFHAHWYTTRVVMGRQPLVQTREDQLAALVLVLCVFGGAVLGLLMGASPAKVRGEAMALGMFAFYFPIKEACLRYERAPGLLAAVVLWLGVFVAVRNYLNLEQIMLAATETWQVSDVRFGTNETELVVGALAALVLAAAWRSWPARIGLFGLFLFLLTSLVITKSRAYWLAFLFGVFLLVVLLNRAERRRFLTLALAGAAGAAGVVIVFFGNAAILLVDGVVRRFATLESAVSQDVSLINRFVETAAVWLRITDNPVLGYGLGYEYGYHSLIYMGHLQTAFIHNGYVWLWYKLGLWGLALVLAFYGRAIGCGLRVYRRGPVRDRAYGLLAAVTLLGLAPAFLTSNGFPLPDVMIVHALLVSLACALPARRPVALGSPTVP